GDFLPVLSPNVGTALTVALNGSSSIQFAQTADPGPASIVSATIAITQSGTASFDWAFSSAESGTGIPGEGFDYEFLLYTIDGVETLLAVDNSNATTTGSETVDLEAGDILAFVLDVDGAFPNTASGSISNFSYVVPEQIIGDDDIYGGFENCWGYVTGEDKTDPVITCPANDP
ncbi:hypothetical protein, partial [Phaeodactylibacter luteus]|uniref:hypothetical protein n=1 Tax=Phaeodactylibacter luteus TaxID=1564516 RepID=UPI001478CE9A